MTEEQSANSPTPSFVVGEELPYFSDWISSKSMLQEYTVWGEWWLPNHPEKKVYGQLTHTSGKSARLDLKGVIDRKFSLFRQTEHIDVIVGISSDGTAITALDCLICDGQSCSPGISVTSYSLRYLLFGRHYPTYESIGFTSFRISFQEIYSFVGIPPLKRDYIVSKGSDLESVEGIEFRKIPVEPFRQAINEDMEITIESEFIAFSEKPDRFVNREQFLTETHAHLVSFNVGFSGPKGIWDIINSAKNIQRYLTLLHGFGISYNFMSCMTKEGSEIKAYVNVSSAYFVSETGRTSRSDLTSMRLGDVRQSFATSLSQWMSQWENLYLPFNLYFSLSDESGSYQEFTFLALMQAAEGYHRRKHSGLYMDEKAYEDVRVAITSAIPSNIDSSHRHALQNRIKYGNEHSLRKRLTGMLADLRDMLEYLGIDVDQFIGSSVDLRNAISHATSTSSEDTRDMDVLIFDWKAVLRMVFLKDLGIDLGSLRAYYKADWARSRYPCTYYNPHRHPITNEDIAITDARRRDLMNARWERSSQCHDETGSAS